ncbi:ester cyclase [Gemmobacter sp.]|uniref:ester cyclase n=1 Tax=Gemmobacter sp. TaxID=1898957 RepID=UPI002AFF6044|nr:ester cyclase [Gemmobacter sp.]
MDSRVPSEMSAAVADSGRRFVALMRRYCNDYTNRHDFSVCDEIMEDDYTLHMGVHDVTGRDSEYKPATLRQFSQFPGLCLTVNQIITNGNRLAMRFSEHGASVRHAGRTAAWSGVGLYHWNGARLVENFVEQDYFARGAQLASGDPNPVENPAIAPWDTLAEPASPANEDLVRRALASGELMQAPELLFDDEWITDQSRPRIIAPTACTVNDIFSAGDHVAFHACVEGTVNPGTELGDGATGRPAFLHFAGIVRVRDGRVVSGRGVRDRIGLMKRLRDA